MTPSEPNEDREYYLLGALPGYEEGTIFRKRDMGVSGKTWLVKTRASFAHANAYEGDNQMLNKAEKFSFLVPGSTEEEAIKFLTPKDENGEVIHDSK